MGPRYLAGDGATWALQDDDMVVFRVEFPFLVCVWGGYYDVSPIRHMILFVYSIWGPFCTWDIIFWYIYIYLFWVAHMLYLMDVWCMFMFIMFLRICCSQRCLVVGTYTWYFVEKHMMNILWVYVDMVCVSYAWCISSYCHIVCDGCFIHA